MGLFNRNKGDSPAPTTSEAGTPPADNDAFDFDAISRDLDVQNGASSFDSLLATPSTNTATPATNSGNSTFDFPENDPLGLGTPSTTVPTTPMTGTAPVAPSPDAVINAPLSPTTSPTTGVAPFEAAPVVTPPVVPVPKAKKSLPIVPLLGALGLLAVAGGGAMFFMNSNQETEPAGSGAPPTSLRKIPPKAPVVPGASSAPGGVVASGAPGSPGVPAANLRSASPGIAPPPSPKQTVGTPRSSSNVSVIPATHLPSATAGLDPNMASKLKALWQAGADAKHRRDYKAARTAWGEALRLSPGHPGFQDSINKLPR